MRLKVAHSSLQFGLSNREHTQDITRLFDRAVSSKLAWITGTESGPGAGNTSDELLRIGEEAGFRLWVPEAEASKKDAASRTDCWIAVNENMIDSEWAESFIPVIPGSAELYKAEGLKPDLKPRWGPKGLVTVSFRNKRIGKINIGAAHYLTGARRPGVGEVHGVNHWEWNKKLADEVGAWAAKMAKGRALAFYGGDQNMADDKNKEAQGDTFFGSALTSAWDELGHWENTGHGCIDVIASYNADQRVQAAEVNAYDDSEFALHTDHFFVTATYVIRDLKK